MSDVFISYARSTEAEAEQVARALRAEGYGVWRDDELPAHRPYADVIEERLKSAKAVVVIWSAEAAKSQWVRAEADAARELGTLVQVSFDQTVPPLPFNQIQCADLKNWDGTTQHAGWRKLQASVEALAGGSGEAEQSPKAQQQTISICVLPFSNMSGDAEQEYFSDGISEDITTDLSKVSALDVTARNTAFQFKGHAVDVCDIARRLGVTHVLEGSVRKAGNCVRVSAQLIQGATGAHLWAERYDRDLTDIFAIQDQISSAVVHALKLKLMPQERLAIEQRGTDSVEAYDLYLLARRYWIGGDFGDRRREETVIRLCGRAVEIDGDYARAWALMALAQANLVYAYTGNETADDGTTAASRALALDPVIAEAHLPRAWHSAVRGCHDEANAEVAKALELEPDSWEVNKEAARLFYRQRRIKDAVRHLERAMAVAPSDFHGRGMLAACYTALGDGAGVRRCAQQLVLQVQDALARDPDNGAALAFGAMSFTALGDAGQARQWRERALLLDADNLYMRYNLAWPILTMSEDKETAIELLKPVLAKAGPNLIRLAASDPNLDSLRSDERFRSRLASAMGRLDPNSSQSSGNRR